MVFLAIAFCWAYKTGEWRNLELKSRAWAPFHWARTRARKDKINFRGIQDALQRNKQENYALYATHRGVLGVIDTLLTILASLVVFYPITYLAQKSKNSVHAFFATDTEKKVNHALDAADEVINCIGSNLI
jgi:hypothetical protein